MVYLQRLNQKDFDLYVATQRINQLLGCINKVQGNIRDEEMRAVFYEDEARRYQKAADTIDLTERVSNRQLALLSLDHAEDTRRRVAQLKEATKLR